jgi:apolipoprotein N-acyltransferase
MTAVICAALSAVGIYFSFGLGEQWWLAWLAPVPVLWLAFGDTKPWPAFFAAWISHALGSASILRAYAGLLPVPVLVMALVVPAVFFAAAVMGARRVQRRLGPLAAMLAFAALWTAFDFLASLSPQAGSVATPAAAEVGAPILIQAASLLGFTAITFLLGFVSAGAALSLRSRKSLPIVLAAALFALNAGYGWWRMSAPPSGELHAALIASDDAVGKVGGDDKDAAFKAIDAYSRKIAKVRDADLIVLPENIARLSRPWDDTARAKLAAAIAGSRSTLVAGFNTRIANAQHNVALAFPKGVEKPAIYVKRRLVPGLETSAYAPGTGPLVLASGTGLEICKDMDFQAMIRADAVATRPEVLAVPAWDFDKDDWSHARVAVLRSVENGVPMARSARDGLLTLNDRYGRVIAMRKTSGSFVTVTGDLPVDGRGGNTLYDRIGDVFGWLCALVSAGLVSLSFTTQRTM